MIEYTDDELLIEFIKHYELDTPELGANICGELSCANCNILTICNSGVRTFAPLFTHEMLELLKRDYPELLI